jgi:hypothetical protein
MKSIYTIILASCFATWSIFAPEEYEPTYVNDGQPTPNEHGIPAGAELAGEQAGAQAAARKPTTAGETRKQPTTVSETSGLSLEPKFTEPEYEPAPIERQPEPTSEWENGSSYEEAMKQATSAAQAASEAFKAEQQPRPTTQSKPTEGTSQRSVTQTERPQTKTTRLLSLIRSAKDIPSAIKAALDSIAARISRSDLIQALKTKTTAFLQKMSSSVTASVDQEVEGLPEQYGLPREYTTDEGIQAISKSKQSIQADQKKAEDAFEKFKKNKGWNKLVDQAEAEKNPAILTINGEQIDTADALHGLEDGSLELSDVKSGVDNGYISMLNDMDSTLPSLVSRNSGSVQARIDEINTVLQVLKNELSKPQSNLPQNAADLYTKYNNEKNSLDNANAAVSLYGKNTPYFKDFNNKINSAKDIYTKMDDIENNLQLEKILTGLVPLE